METINSPKTSAAERVVQPLQKAQKLLKKIEQLADVEPPLLMLMRRTKDVEWYEKASSGEFHFTHSNSLKYTIFLNPGMSYNVKWKNQKIPIYFVHEDFSEPLSDIQEIQGDQMAAALEKTLSDVKKWRAKELTAAGGLAVKIGIGIAIIIGAVIAAGLMGINLLEPFQNTAPAAIEPIKQIPPIEPTGDIIT